MHQHHFLAHLPAARKPGHEGVGPRRHDLGSLLLAQRPELRPVRACRGGAGLLVDRVDRLPSPPGAYQLDLRAGGVLLDELRGLGLPIVRTPGSDRLAVRLLGLAVLTRTVLAGGAAGTSATDAPAAPRRTRMRVPSVSSSISASSR